MLQFQPAEYVAKLKCHMKDLGNPFYKLNPIFEEEVHKQPDIWMYHEVVTFNERLRVKELAKPLVIHLIIYVINYQLQCNYIDLDDAISSAGTAERSSKYCFFDEDI